MGRILDTTRYPIDGVPSATDYVIGTDKDNSLRTKNYLIGDLLSLLSGTGLQNGLLSGAVSWISGLTFEASPLTYIIGEIFYSSDGGFVTLADADPTDPRIDLIIVDNLGVVSSVTGVPAPSPQKPIIADNSTQLELTFVTVEAGATEPLGIASDQVYDENLGTPSEWDATENTTGARINFTDTVDPFQGTLHTTLTSPLDGDTITFTDDAPTLVSTISNLHFHLKLTNTFDADSKILITFYDGVNVVSDTIAVEDGRYGLDRTDITNYQSIIIPISAFTFSGGQITNVKVETLNLETKTFYFDNFFLVTGIQESEPDPGTSGTFVPLVVDGSNVDNYPTQSGTGFYYRIGKLTFIDLSVAGLGVPDSPGAVFKIIGLPNFIASNSPRGVLNCRLTGTNGAVTYYDIRPLINALGEITFVVKATPTGDPTATLNAFTLVAGSMSVQGVLYTS